MDYTMPGQAEAACKQDVALKTPPVFFETADVWTIQCLDRQGQTPPKNVERAAVWTTQWLDSQAPQQACQAAFAGSLLCPSNE